MKFKKINYKPDIWLILLLTTNLFFSFVVWLTVPKAFEQLLIMITLFTLIITLTGHSISCKKQKNLLTAFEDFLANIDEETEEKLLDSLNSSWRSIVQTASTQLKEQEQIIKEKQLELVNYQEFIEAWTHEIKTPLSLATLVLENNKEDMSPYIYKRMKHVRYAINADVEKILYYARLQADHIDYRFERILLGDLLEECLEIFYPIAKEKGVDLQVNVIHIPIVSDKKVLSFIISQLLSNAFKYTPSTNGFVKISSWQDNTADSKIHLTISDNGKGVPLEDLPFLFDKGFTGNHKDRQEATGMGLYFTQKYTENLSIEIQINKISTSGKGFEIELIFPHVVE